MTATDDWITFADSHFMPHENLDKPEGWPPGEQPSLLNRSKEVSDFALGSMGPARVAKLKAMGIEQ